MRVLITGAGGQLGRELQATAPSETEVLARDRGQLDVTCREDVEKTTREASPDVVIHAAAYTAVDRAETEKELAQAVNAEGARHLAQATTAISARLIHLSTDFVFDGTGNRPYAADATANPQSVYGASKWQGERNVLELTAGEALVLRTAWVYSRFGQNFVKTMLRLLAEQSEVSVVADQVGSPTWARGLAEAIWRAADRPDLRGIHHWTDAGVASWYDVAVAVQEEAAAAGLLKPDCVIRPVDTADFPTTARRPAYSVLDKGPTWRALDFTPPHWRRQLRSMLYELKEHGDG